LAAHVAFKAEEKTGIETSARPRLSESSRSRWPAGVGPGRSRPVQQEMIAEPRRWLADGKSGDGRPRARCDPRFKIFQSVLDPSFTVVRPFAQQERAAHTARHAVVSAGQRRIDQLRAIDRHRVIYGRIRIPHAISVCPSRSHCRTFLGDPDRGRPKLPWPGKADQTMPVPSVACGQGRPGSTKPDRGGSLEMEGGPVL